MSLEGSQEHLLPVSALRPLRMKEVSCLRLRRGGRHCPEPDPAGTLILALQAPDCEKEIPVIYKPPCLRSSVAAAQTDQDKHPEGTVREQISAFSCHVRSVYLKLPEEAKSTSRLGSAPSALGPGASLSPLCEQNSPQGPPLILRQVGPFPSWLFSPELPDFSGQISCSKKSYPETESTTWKVATQAISSLPRR